MAEDHKRYYDGPVTVQEFLPATDDQADIDLFKRVVEGMDQLQSSDPTFKQEHAAQFIAAAYAYCAAWLASQCANQAAHKLFDDMPELTERSKEKFLVPIRERAVRAFRAGSMVGGAAGAEEVSAVMMGKHTVVGKIIETKIDNVIQNMEDKISQPLADLLTEELAQRKKKPEGFTEQQMDDALAKATKAFRQAGENDD